MQSMDQAIRVLAQSASVELIAKQHHAVQHHVNMKELVPLMDHLIPVPVQPDSVVQIAK